MCNLKLFHCLLNITAPLSATTSNNKEEDKTKNWTYNPFDVNDLSPIDTLFRRGPVPFAVRIIRSERYEEAVLQYMAKDGVDRATAQRIWFNDPNGWVVAKQRERDLGEVLSDINAPTGVQKRPIFSALWATFCFWLFFVFFPTRIDELGGIHPVYNSNGMCKVAVRSESGKLVCPQNIDNALDL